MLKIHYLCGDKDNTRCNILCTLEVVICSKFITFAVTKTTVSFQKRSMHQLWFAQNSLPLRWQRQPSVAAVLLNKGCDLLKIHYLCGDKDNEAERKAKLLLLWFAQNSLPLRWQRQPVRVCSKAVVCCDLLKIHYLCGDKDNPAVINLKASSVVICSKFITFAVTKTTLAADKYKMMQLWFAQNSLPLRWQRQLTGLVESFLMCCDLLKIHYLCGDKDNPGVRVGDKIPLWFAQNSLPLRWQRQHHAQLTIINICCDLLKIHYLCGDKDNLPYENLNKLSVVICSKFITFAVTKTTFNNKSA